MSDEVKKIYDYVSKSENGYHYICCLPYLKMMDCIKGFVDYYTGIKNISTNRE